MAYKKIKMAALRVQNLNENFILIFNQTDDGAQGNEKEMAVNKAMKQAVKQAGRESNIFNNETSTG